MTKFKRSPNLRPGTWRAYVTPSGVQTATICCPRCGTCGGLQNHRIAPNGEISPKLTCPKKDCYFHDTGMLEGWREE